jgi:hypothetical protein
LKVSVLPAGFKIRFEGVKRAIAFKDAQWEIMGKIQPTARARIEATMKAYCQSGPENIPPQRFKFEKQFEHGGKKTRVEAFKARHVRIYGACGGLGGRPIFLVTGTDTSKKTDAADQKKLRAAGQLAHELIHGSNRATSKRK